MSTSPTLPRPIGERPAPPRRRTRTRTITPRRRGWTTTLREGWRDRRLVPFFAGELLQKLYARTWLGILWLPLRPGIDLLLKVGVIGTLIGSPAPGVPYLLYALVGMALWEWFEKLAFWGTRSLEVTRSLTRRVYVPRLPIVLGAVGPASVFFGLYVIAGILAVAWFLAVDGTTHLVIGANTLAAVAGFGLLTSLGLLLGLICGPIAYHARDIRFLLGYALGFWFYITPILYPPDHMDGLLGLAVTVNPLSAPVVLFQHGLLGTPMPSGTSVAVTLGTLAVLLPIALFFFARAETVAAEAA